MINFKRKIILKKIFLLIMILILTNLNFLIKDSKKFTKEIHINNNNNYFNKNYKYYRSVGTISDDLNKFKSSTTKYNYDIGYTWDGYSLSAIFFGAKAWYFNLLDPIYKYNDAILSKIFSNYGKIYSYHVTYYLSSYRGVDDGTKGNFYNIEYNEYYFYHHSGNWDLLKGIIFYTNNPQEYISGFWLKTP